MIPFNPEDFDRYVDYAQEIVHAAQVEAAADAIAEGRADVTTLHNGTILEHHGPAVCTGLNCCFHNPSSHPLDQAPLNWRRYRSQMERICPHGVGHPDPDDVAQYGRVHGPQRAFSYAVHGCDGCCSAPRQEAA